MVVCGIFILLIYCIFFKLFKKIYYHSALFHYINYNCQSLYCSVHQILLKKRTKILLHIHLYYTSKTKTKDDVLLNI